MLDRTAIVPAFNLADLAAEIRREHAAVLHHARKALDHALTAGERLLEAKGQLRHGEWLPWIKQVGIPERTCQHYMRLARHADDFRTKSASFADLTIESAIAAIADTVPDDDGPRRQAPALPRLSEPVAVLLDAAFQLAGADVVASYLRVLEQSTAVSPDRFDAATRSIKRQLTETKGTAPTPRDPICVATPVRSDGRMRPMFSFFGSKWKLAKRLGPPRHDHVIECFAGSAGYSLFHAPPKVTLIELDPVIVGVWRYLTKVSPAEIMTLPAEIESIEELPSSVCEEARALIGFWLNHGLAAPALRRSNWAKKPRYRSVFWSESIKGRIASQVEKIRHWRIVEGDYREAPDVIGHWLIDPPYSTTGQTYRCNDIDYAELAEWCRTRRGFVQVCETPSADWMPFTPIGDVTTPRPSRRLAAEGVFEMGQ
jgi:hypothetical protein